MKFTPKKLLLPVLALTLTFSCKKDEFSNSSSHSVAEWIKVFSGLNAANSSLPQVPIVSTDDGGMYVTYFNNQNEVYIIKVNSNGILEWKKDIQQVAYNLYAARLKDGSLVVVGDKGDGSCFSYKISSDEEYKGSSEFSVSNPFPTSNVFVLPKAINENDDGTLMVLGSIFTNNMRDTVIDTIKDDTTYYSEVIFVSKLGADLSHIYSSYLEFPVPAAQGEGIRLQPAGIIQVPGNRYLINGNAFNTSKFSDTILYSIFTCLADEQGNLIDSKPILTGVDVRSLNHLADGGYRATMGPLFLKANDSYITWVSPVCYDNQLNSWLGDNRQRIMLFNADGESTETIFYDIPPPPNVPFGMRKQGGGFLLLSALPNTPTTVPTKQISQSINVTDDGQVLQQRAPEGFLNFTFTSCCQLADGHYAIAGLVQQSGEAQWQLCIIKTDKDGNY